MNGKRRVAALAVSRRHRKKPRFTLRIGLEGPEFGTATGFAANVRWGPTEYGCYGGLRPAPVDSGRLEGTNEGTERTRGHVITAELLGVGHMLGVWGSSA
jgi:hypothetical protein